MRIQQWFLIVVVLLGGINGRAACPVGDLNGDCLVGMGDLIAFADVWLDDISGGANLDGLDAVDMTDFSILVSHWGDRGYQLVINELMADNTATIEDPDEAGEYPDWIELYNYGTTSIDTGGMILKDETNTWTIPANASAQTTIQPGGYLLFWADDDTEQGPRHTNFKLGAGGDEVGLYTADNESIDQKVFGSLSADQSYGRYPNGGPGWQKFDSGTATPGTSNGGQSIDAGIIINEIMYHPGHNELAFEPEPVGLEYIELHNTGSSAVDLSGWRIVDGVSFELPADTLIAANGYRVIAADTTAFSQAYPTVTNVVGGWTGKLNNQDERITIINAIGTVIDSVHYYDEGEWADRILGPVEYYHRGWEWSDAHDGGGRSLELITTTMSNEYGRNWKAAQPDGGTPGRANSQVVSDVPPLILDVEHTPVIPASDQPVTVTAKVTDENLSSVSMTLYWRLDTSVYSQSEYPVYDAESYTTVTMLDDGLSGDQQAGDGIFGVTIPAQSNGRIIEFFVEADDTANTRSWPAPCEVDGQLQQVANCLYQVDDSFDLSALTAAGTKPVYYLVMTASERGRLADIGDEDTGDNNERYSRVQMNGTFISVVNSQIKCRYGVGYRNRGEGSSGRPPNNVRINFRSDTPYDGTTKINCNSKYTYLQVAGSRLFASAGFYAAPAAPVQLYVNGTQPALTDMSSTYGYYAASRPYGSEWLDQYVLTDPNEIAGNIYKASSGRWYADLSYLGTDPAEYASDGYSKLNNASENEWADLFRLTEALANTAAADYAEQLETIVDVKQWMRWFAMCTLIGYNENGLAVSRGDDYCMYRTGDTGLFELLIYDLDTVLHVAHEEPPLDRSIFYAADRDSTYMPVLDRFFAEPEYVQEFYVQLMDLIQTFYPAEKINPLLDETVKGWIPDSMLADMKNKTAQRVEQVLLQIPQEFSIQSTLPVVNGYAQTTNDTATLTGKANAVTTRSVYVNNAPASWDPIDGDWLGSVSGLLPGVNRIVVETYGMSDGQGVVLETGTFDIWYNDGSESTIAGTQSVDRVLTAADGAWHVTGDIVIPAGVTLTVEPGTTLFFDNNTGITVNGRLLMQGTAYRRVHLAPTPGQTRWDGILFANTLTDSRLEYADMLYGDAQGKSIIVEYARVTMDHMTWASSGGNTRIMELTHPSAVICKCVLPSISSTEPVHGNGLTGDEYLIFEGNTFGSTTGYNDIVDFTGAQRPGPIIEFYNNTFLGGGDDGPDLDSTDGHVEGNLFKNFHQTTPDQDSPSYAVATGDQSQVCVVRNVFIDNDHAVLHKEDVYSWTQNNTILNSTIAAISFGEPFRSPPRDPGKGTLLDSNIFWNNAAVFEHYFDNPSDYGPTGTVGVFHSLLPSEFHFFGSDNIAADPMLKDPLGDWTLLPGSSAVGAGSNGQDMGANVPAGASVSGEPDTVTWQTSAILTVSGPGITHYKYRLVDNGIPGVWSSEYQLPINADDFPADPNHIGGQIQLTGLQNGHAYRVDVIGMNSAGQWQGQPFRDTTFTAPGLAGGNASRTWTVDSASHILLINEVLADNAAIAHEGTYPDMIELYYDGPAPLDLGGYRLTDNSDVPDKFVFTAGTLINPGEYKVIYADTETATSGIHTGFFIDADGDDLTLLNPAGVVIDAVAFGIQLENHSIGRTGYDRQWKLTSPTLGTANQIVPLGDPRNLKINEWLTAGKILFVEDRVELFNPSAYPVNMGGLYLTDNPAAHPDKHQMRPLSFIAGNGFASLVANGNKSAGAHHLDFKLDSRLGAIALFDSDLTLLDQIVYDQQRTDVSQGRKPDGAQIVEYFNLPTPGAVNTYSNSIVTNTDLIGIEDDWAYEQSGTDLGTAWRDPGYDDTAWPIGAALLYVESSSLPAPKNTPLTLGPNVFYFRKDFTFDGNPGDVDRLELTTVLDDGAVIYLNGVEVLKIRLSGTVVYSDYADTVGNAVLENFEIPADALLNGDNVIAVEVHQTSAGSSDVVFGLAMTAVSETINPDDPYAESRAVMEGLRITEIMYNPAADPNSEYVELQNISDTAINLESVRFTNGIDFVFPPMTLEPDEFTVVVADRGVFESRYGTQINIAGQYVGKLDNGNDALTLKLAEPLDAAVMRFEYKDGWYPITDGVGHSLVIADASQHPESWQDSENWRPSVVAGGAPGRADTLLVVINEVLAHSHAAAPDWIELYNPTASPINVGGWYLSDDPAQLMKYRIAADTIIAPDAYLVMYEDLHFANPADPDSLVQFALSENGDGVYLSAAENGILIGYAAEAEFGASETDVSFGRYEKSDGTTVFVLMDANTPGQANSAPKVGPAVISEFMYNPPAGGAYPADDYEYIKLHNISAEAVTLQVYDGSMGLTLGWRFTAGIDFTFPLGTTIPAGGYLIVARNPAAFAERYGSTGGVTVLGPFENDTKLSNGGERLELSMPGDTDLQGVRYYIQVDSVLYDDEFPWPAAPDGTGNVLDRIDDTAFGDDAANWQSQPPSAGQ